MYTWYSIHTCYRTLILFATVCICILIDRLFRPRIVNFDGMEIPGPKSLPLIGNVFDVDLRGLHLSLSKMSEKYGSFFRIKLLGQNIVIINDAELERKAFGNTRYGDVFNDRPDTFVGQYFCFNYSDITFANANKKTMTKRKLFHRSLKFEPRCEKTSLRGFRPSPTQTRLHNHRRWLEA